MALPILNNATLHEMTIPSTGKTVSYRPYLVKEEKILLQAKESNDDKMIMRSILKLIDACVEDVDTKKLTSFDVEYIFVKLRAQSTGENVDLIYKCPHCDTQNDIKVNINDVVMSKDATKVDKIVKLTNDVSLEMKFYTYDELVNLSTANKSETTETFEIIKSSILAVNTEDERIIFADESTKDQDAFIDSLSSNQFEKIAAFVAEEMPYLQYNETKKCTSCNEDYEVNIKGLNDFF